MASAIPHHTDDEVTGYLKRALDCVDAADVPPDLTEAAFNVAVTLLSSKQLFFTDADVAQASPIAIPRINNTPIQ